MIKNIDEVLNNVDAYLKELDEEQDNEYCYNENMKNDEEELKESIENISVFKLKMKDQHSSSKKDKKLGDSISKEINGENEIKDPMRNINNKESNESVSKSQKSLKDAEKTNNRYADDFDYIRLNKSCEPIKEVRQHMDQFDTEYMCRCLGLAIMKHIEASKEYFHILEIIGSKEQFNFFNSIYNMNIDFFNTFYNLEAKMSNLEKIDFIEYSDKKKASEGVGTNKQHDDEFPKKISQTEFDKVIKNEELRSGTFGHINYVKNDTTKNDKEDFSILNKDKQSDELVKELNIINDQFKKLTTIDNPTNFKVRGQELSLIKEEDSHEFGSRNYMISSVEGVNYKVENKNADYINLLQSSMAGFLGVKEKDVKLFI